MIRLEQISKYYFKEGKRIPALDHVDLEVKKGAFLSVIGPSGSGKTTLMNILGCLDTPSEGSYYLSGKPVTQLRGRTVAALRNREIGFIFQSFNLIPALSAAENVALPLMLRGVPQKERNALALEALSAVGLASRCAHRPWELSGGQQQRVAIARVLAAQPPLILADEPTGNLDGETRDEILSLLCDLHRNGSTLVMITHDAGIAAAAPRILRMQSGKLFPC